MSIPVPVDTFDDTRALAKFGLVIAGNLRKRDYPFAAQVEQLARLVLEGAQVVEPLADRCTRCGRVLEQPTTGRRRVWCSDACRRAAAKRGRKSTVR